MLLLQGRTPELQQDRAVATFTTIFIGTAERHDIYIFCLLFTIFATKSNKETRPIFACTKLRQEKSESPSSIGTSHGYSTTTTATNISYAFFTLG